MKKFKRRKSIEGLMMVIVSITDIFIMVLSGKMGNRFMLFGIILLAIGFNAINMGKAEMLEIDKRQEKGQQLDKLEERACAVTLFIIQFSCFIGIGVAALTWWIMDSHPGVFRAVIVTFGCILAGSFVIHGVLEKFIAKKKLEI